MAIYGTWLGQSGLRVEFESSVIYIDPYLSNSVEAAHGDLYRRQLEIPMAPEQVTDADFVLITHGHMDHCDPDTLPGIAEASPQAQFLAPAEVASSLRSFGISQERILTPVEKWIDLEPGLRVRPVPAAHPDLERDAEGCLRHLGFVLDCEGRRVYHAGDTSPHGTLLETLKLLAPIHVAVLPVNEFNFFRSRMGIVGNMSVREAFALAEEIGAQKLVPIHWDMFEPNSVHPEEIELLFEMLAPAFELSFRPDEI